MRIEVCGGIASGKTTFAEIFHNSATFPVLEKFEINPFLAAFYTNPPAYAFETEITFLLQHYHQIKINHSLYGRIICDFSIYLDLAYADVTLHGSKHKTFEAIYDEIQHELAVPDLLIHLRCSAEAELERIQRRGRMVEEAISLEYLAAVNQAVEVRVQEVKDCVQVVIIDSEHCNFATDMKVRADMLRNTQRQLHEARLYI